MICVGMCFLLLVLLVFAINSYLNEPELERYCVQNESVRGNSVWIVSTLINGTFRYTTYNEKPMFVFINSTIDEVPIYWQTNRCLDWKWRPNHDTKT